MNNLGMSYSNLGRHSEALAMRESVLEFMRRVLPADHPWTGEGRVWGVLLRALFFGGCYAVLMRLMCRHSHQQSWCDIQQPRKAFGSACEAGERAGYL